MHSPETVVDHTMVRYLIFFATPPFKGETVGDTRKGVSLGDSQIIGTTGTLSHEGECILPHAEVLEAGHFN